MRWFGGSSQSEFVYQDCVKLIGHGGARKHSCALKCLFIQNTCSITNFLPTSLTTCLKSKIKNTFKLKWIKLKKFFFSQLFAPWWDQLNSKQINKKKYFLWQKCLLREYLCVWNVSIIHRVICFTFAYVDLQVITDFKIILLGSIWVVLILGAHPSDISPHFFFSL